MKRPHMTYEEIATHEHCTVHEARQAFWSGIYKLQSQKRMRLFLALVEEALGESGVNYERRVA